MNRLNSLSCKFLVAAASCLWAGAAAAEPADPPAPAPEAAPAETSATASTDASASTATASATTDAATPAEQTPPAGEAAAAKKPAASAPYMLPFYLRGITPGTVVRLESTYAMYKVPAPVDKSGNTLTSVLTATYKVAPWIAPIARVGLVRNSFNDESGMAISNLGLGALFGVKLDPTMRLGFAAIATVPTGTGAGNDPDVKTATAMKSAGAARYAFDSSIYANNDTALIGGADFAYIDHGLTAQVEATIFQFMRIRGDEVQKDEKRTLLTSGLFLGYFVIPQLSLGAELRYSHWLSTPAAVEANDAARNNLSAGGGVRGHFKFGESVWFRPGLSYHQALDEPISESKYKYIQLDLPFAF
ncbi:MAG TPA: hypothetical protein PLI95_22955 [Polyangiaceae bacterium]|nr:hypothetical protein [Polyangiaceae bacterium]